MPSRLAQLMGALRGPVMLMTLGLLLWLWQAHGVRFRLTWPLLVIVFGVMKLLEALAPRLEAQRPPGPSSSGLRGAGQ